MRPKLGKKSFLRSSALIPAAWHSPEADCFLREVQWRTGGNPELLLNNINPGDLFRNRMFNLNARIHFHEINIFVNQQEFNGARAFISYGSGGFYCQLAQSVSQLIADLGLGAISIGFWFRRCIEQSRS